MSRYIDADKLCEHLQNKLKTDYEMGLYNHGALTESFIRFVERQPTAAVVEIRHGEWLPNYETFVDDLGRETQPIITGRICSLCSEDSLYESQYCPNCGAKMDKERSENGA